MKLINFKVEKLIIHQVFQRDDDGNKVAPTQSAEFTNFDSNAMEQFKQRVMSALGEGSKAVEMIVNDPSEDGLPKLIKQMSTEMDNEFAVTSYKVAEKLTNAQHRRSIPGGIVVVFRGTYGANNRKYVGIIKAEIHSAYQKEENKNTKEISLKFVEEVLLTPSAKLYKTAGFFSVPSDEGKEDTWSVLVSDSQINQSDGKAAAQYFYADFLGCGYPQSNARTTKQFYEATGEFIRSMDCSEEEKTGYFNALTTYLKFELTPNASAEEFGDRFFEADVKDSYVNHIADRGLPTTAFGKDTEFVESKLKVRKVSFGKNIKLTAPADVFRDKVEVESIEAENGETWSRLTIKDKVSYQE